MQILRTKILGFALLLAGLALCGTGLWLLLSPAQYRATATIEAGYDLGYDVTESADLNDSIKPTFERIRSPVILSNVWKSLNLNAVWYNNKAKAINFLQRRMSLQLVPNTTLIEINFSSEDPNEAARIANAIAKSCQDYYFERRRQLKTQEIQVLAQKFQEEEQSIKAMHGNLEQLRKQLNLPNSELAEELLKSNYPSYFQAKQKLQEFEEFHRAVAAKIEADNLDKFVISDPPVIFEAVAELPKFPVSPNRWLGATLLAIGLLTTVRGFFLLKSSCHRSRT